MSLFRNSYSSWKKLFTWKRIWQRIQYHKHFVCSGEHSDTSILYETPVNSQWHVFWSPTTPPLLRNKSSFQEALYYLFEVLLTVWLHFPKMQINIPFFHSLKFHNVGQIYPVVDHWKCAIYETKIQNILIPGMQDSQSVNNSHVLSSIIAPLPEYSCYGNVGMLKPRLTTCSGALDSE